MQPIKAAITLLKPRASVTPDAANIALMLEVVYVGHDHRFCVRVGIWAGM